MQNQIKLEAHLSTADMPAGKRPLIWEERLEAAGLGGTLRVGEEFHVDSLEFKFGSNNVYFYDCSASEHLREAGDCRTKPSDVFFLSYLRKGSIQFHQGRRTALAQAGEAFLCYSGEPSFQQTSDFEATSLAFPRRVIEGCLPSPLDPTALSITRSSPWGFALCSVLSVLAPNTLKDIALPPDMVMEQINALLALALGPPAQTSTSYQAHLLCRLRKSIRTYAADPGFTPAQCAQEHKISPRTLHTAFANAGTSFCRELMETRMDLARQKLEDRRFARTSIAEIAAMTGYLYPGHFITLFRRRYGLTPAAYRKQVLD